MMKELTGGCSNFVFLGEAGCGKSEIAINFARILAKEGEKKVHFFDMDMTKPLFRSRDLREEIAGMNIEFHYEEQFMDAPTLAGGVRRLLKDEDCFVVMDVGGDYIGARSIGGFAPLINQENTAVYYVLNAYRPWSGSIDQIDKTLGSILGVSHVQLEKLQLVNNPNLGYKTTADDFREGCMRMKEMITPYKEICFSCVRQELYEEVKDQVNEPLIGIELFLTYPWSDREESVETLNLEADEAAL